MKNIIILNIKGKNIENFIRKINKNKIDILKITYLKYNEINIEVNYSDYNKILSFKTIYEINIIGYKGLNSIKHKLIYNKYMLISILIGFIIYTILSNMIFTIDIEYSGNNLKEIVSNELYIHNIKKFYFMKSYNELETIKKDILNNNKDKIEWLDIERVGTKYIVKLEPRKINEIPDNNKIYNIVAGKDCIIKSIESSSGEVVKNINNYVKKGDTIINSNITLDGEVKNQVSAKGRIYGEVWYLEHIEYPLDYYEEKETGKEETGFNIHIINKDINFNKFEHNKTTNKVLLKFDLLPISLTYQTRKELEIINDKLDKETATTKALETAHEKLMSTLSTDEYIITEKSLKTTMKESKIIIDIFYTVYEDVTEYIEIG